MSAALLALAVLVGWEACVRLGAVDPLILPAPTHVAEALWTDRGLLADDLAATAGIVALGLGASVAGGIALAVLMHQSRRAHKALHPLVIGSQAVPLPVIAPLLVVVLGFGAAPKVLMVALICFFPVTINLLDGLRSVDPERRKLFRTLGAPRWATFRLLEAPSALPQAFTGLRIAAAVSVIGAVFAEWSGAERGLGHGLLVASGQLESARAFAAVTLLFALAVALYALFALAERRLVTWTGEP